MQSLGILLLFDIFYSTLIAVCYFTNLPDKYFIVIVLIAAAPYGILVVNLNNKFKSWQSNRYGRRKSFIERLYNRQAIVMNRAMLIAFAISGIITIVFENKTVIVLYLVLSAVFIVFQVYTYAHWKRYWDK